MNTLAIFYPVGALVLLTYLVLLLVGFARQLAVRKNQVELHYFKTYMTGSPTDFMVQTKNNFSNLFETPLHFYLICILLYITKTVDPTFLLLAWIYVGLRVFHSLIHVTSNYLPMRFLAFLLSIGTLLFMWLRWFFAIV